MNTRSDPVERDRHRQDVLIAVPPVVNLVHHPPNEQDPEAADRPMPHGTEVIDVTPLGAYALVARRRTESALARALPIGPTGAPAETPMAPTLIEMRLKAIPQRAGQMIGGRPLGGEIQACLRCFITGYRLEEFRFQIQIPTIVSTLQRRHRHRALLFG